MVFRFNNLVDCDGLHRCDFSGITQPPSLVTLDLQPVQGLSGPIFQVFLTLKFQAFAASEVSGVHSLVVFRSCNLVDFRHSQPSSFTALQPRSLVPRVAFGSFGAIVYKRVGELLAIYFQVIWMVENVTNIHLIVVR